MPIDQFLSTAIARGETISDMELFVRNKEQTEGLHVRASAIPLFGENQEGGSLCVRCSRHHIGQNSSDTVGTSDAATTKSGSIDGYHFQ